MSFSDLTPMTASWLVWVTPLAFLAGSLLTGLWLRRGASRVRWQGGKVILRSIRGPVVVWSLMAGLYLGMTFSQVPEAVVDVAGRILKVLWVFSVAWVGASTVSQLITLYASRWQVALPMTSLTQHLAKGVILSLGALVILDTLGVRIGTLLAALGIGSLAVALGLQDTLANLFAGVSVTLSTHIRVGDYIKLEGGQEGYVTDIGWRATKIRTLPNSLVIIPNAKLSQAIITNYDLPEKELAVLVNVGIDYASDLERVERVTLEVAREVMRTVPGGILTAEPLVRYHTFGEYAVTCTVVMRAQEFVDQYLIIHEFIKRLHKRYQQDGIVMPSPIRMVSTKSS